MMLEPISLGHACAILRDRDYALIEPTCGFAISVVNDNADGLHGIIVMDTERECKLVNLWTDNTALVGSILYGAAWRAAKALGYKTITI